MTQWPFSLGLLAFWGKRSLRCQAGRSMLALWLGTTQTTVPGDEDHLPWGLPFLCVTDLSVWELPPALGLSLCSLPALCSQWASLYVGTWTIDTQAYSPFSIAHPFPWHARPTVANSKPPTHVKPLKTVSVGKTTAIAPWPSATSRHRQSEKQFERTYTALGHGCLLLKRDFLSSSLHD